MKRVRESYDVLLGSGFGCHGVQMYPGQHRRQQLNETLGDGPHEVSSVRDSDLQKQNQRELQGIEDSVVEATTSKQT
jgi:hypothetical protein